MTDPVARIAFLSDTHLGYRATGCGVHEKSQLNHRVRDGYLALRATVDQILVAAPDAVIHGGDLFHRSWPTVADIVWARQELARLADAGIPVYINTGNHDASAEKGSTAATAAVNDPERGIHVVTAPSAEFTIVDGLQLHVVSHYGLARKERIVPTPTAGELNIVSAHGAAVVPGHEIFATADSPGEQPIGADILADPGWAVKLLGHFHTLGQVPGVGTARQGECWYAGSALRRGFADAEGGRGWLMVQVGSDGGIDIAPHYIPQRPQFDLPAIDAAGLTGEEVFEKMREQIGQVDTAQAIIRQVIVNITATQRSGMRAGQIDDLAPDALQWQLVPRRPETTVIQVDPDDSGGAQVVSDSMSTVAASDLPAAYSTWAPAWAEAVDLPAELHQVVASEGESLLAAASSADTDDLLVGVVQ